MRSHLVVPCLCASVLGRRGRQAVASAAGLIQFRSTVRGNGFVMHNVFSLTVSVPSIPSLKENSWKPYRPYINRKPSLLP